LDRAGIWRSLAIAAGLGEDFEMLSRLLFLAGLFAAALATAPDARAERRVAFVVGNAAYTNGPALPNPANDASDMAESLRKTGFEVLLATDLDQQGFARSIERFANMLDGADVALFFYAGHGLQINDKNYLVSVNAQLTSEFLVPAETIELDMIIRLMESKAAVNLVFLDACRNNPLAESLRRNLVALKRSAVLGRGLARVEPTGRDTLVAFAAAPGQEAADGSNQRNSPFTSALLRHMTQPGQEISVMLKQVAADVRRDTQSAQRPQQLSDMTRTFYFTKGGDQLASNEAGAKPEPPKHESARPAAGAANDRAVDVAFWTAAQSANECEAMKAYLARFPNGVFVELAKISERRLCATTRVAAADPAPNPPAAGMATVNTPPVGGMPPAGGALTSEPSIMTPPAGAPPASPPPAIIRPAGAPPAGFATLPSVNPSLAAPPALPSPAANPQVAAPSAPVPEAAPVPPVSQPSAPPPAPLKTPLPSTLRAPGVAAAPTAPSANPMAPSPNVELVRSVQMELKRVGCGNVAVDGQWSDATREGVRRFNEQARWRFDTNLPSPGLLSALQRSGEYACPMECEAGFELSGNTCVPAQQRASTPAAPDEPRASASPKRKNVERTREERRRHGEERRQERRERATRHRERSRQTAGDEFRARQPTARAARPSGGGPRNCRFVPRATGGGFNGDTITVCD
jgi:uncharacterized caspase-like protein